MKKYPAYKDSGIEWIRQVPKDWQVNRLKTFCTFTYGDSLANEDRVEGDIPVYGSNGVVGYHNKAITHKPCIIIGRKGSYGKVNFSETECFPIDTTYFVDNRSAKCDLKWLNYVLALLELDRFSKDTGVPGLNREDAHNKRVPIPEADVQKSIAKYLDLKTAQIDDLIAKKERMIELLKEERTAIINQAVTKGLDRKVKMKDSGVNWIGHIPIAWGIKKLKHVLRNFDGKRIPLSAEERSGMLGEYPYYGSNGIVGWVNDYLFDGEYILLGEDGAPFFELYRDVAFLVHGKFWVNNHAHILKADHRYSQRFLTYALNRVDYRRHITGSTRDKLTQDDMSVIELPIPSLAEQEAISNYLDKKTTQIDGQVSREKRSIELLKKYRTALISEVVTGKIDVRGRA